MDGRMESVERKKREIEKDESTTTQGNGDNLFMYRVAVGGHFPYPPGQDVTNEVLTSMYHYVFMDVWYFAVGSFSSVIQHGPRHVCPALNMAGRSVGHSPRYDGIALIACLYRL